MRLEIKQNLFMTAKPLAMKPVKHLPKIVHVTINMHNGNKCLTVYLKVAILSFSLDEENGTLLSSFAHKMLKITLEFTDRYKLDTRMLQIKDRDQHAHSFVVLT